MPPATSPAVPDTAFAPDPAVYESARPARAVAPTTRLGEVFEALRAAPYPVIAVVDDPAAVGRASRRVPPRLLGLVTERGIAAALLAAGSPEERAAVRALPASAVMEPVRHAATGDLRARDAAARMDEAGAEALPVVVFDPTGGEDAPRYLGLVSRSDLVRELVRPFRPPTIGGLATPTGVYLTTGAVSGGVGAGALLGSGLALWAANTLATAALTPLQVWAGRGGGGAVGAALGGEVVGSLLTMAVYLAALRLSPIAGYHAAEHQVVHAVERGEPLLPEAVRAMPRVHPRCGTNLVAGLALLGTLGAALSALIGAIWPAGTDLGWFLGGIIALATWRSVGAWLQQHVTTRPASDAQIESGIRAAREVLERHGRDPYRPERPLGRLWRLGFLQILGGYLIGYVMLYALLAASPALRQTLGPWLPLHDLL